MHELRVWLEWHAVTLTALASFAVGCIGILALVLAYFHLRHVRKTARIQHLLDIEREFDSMRWREIRSAWARKKRDGQPGLEEATALCDFMERVGLLVKRDYVTAGDVWERFGYAILCLSAALQPAGQEIANHDQAALAQKMREIELKRGGAFANPSAADIQSFLEQQLNPATATIARPPKRIVR